MTLCRLWKCLYGSGNNKSAVSIKPEEVTLHENQPQKVLFSCPSLSMKKKSQHTWFVMNTRQCFSLPYVSRPHITQTH
jgi:hypothetical protein